MADEEGIDAASMQRIAAEIGVTKMALYRHVPGRTELVALMIESAMDQPPDTSGPWRDGLRAWAEAMRVSFSAHRWLSTAVSGARLIGPVELGWLEAGLAPLAAVPLNGSERLDTLALISSHVRGMLLQHSDADTEADISGRLVAVLADRERQFPLSVAAFREATDTGATDQAYGYGLDRILDGVDTLVEQRSTA